ncbi:MAG: hypothetical protein K8U57_11615 [Planctomycetes bacterium]|nr:hypothetical protein [Planctomycetota bacterium]
MRKFGTVIVVFAGLTFVAYGQFPSVPSAPVPVAPPITPSVATPGAAAPRNIFSMFCMTPDQKAACKAKFCNSAIGKVVNSMLSPLGAVTGGLIGPTCSGPSPADLAKPATSAEGAAARIKQDEANAAARRAAVRYLGTVSCKYYPEAEPALISALRGDPSECVRIEAAKAFANGCCCSKKTIAALTMSVNGGTKDGFPSENSECVRALAYAALQVCVATYQEPVKPPEKATPKEKEKESAAGPCPYYDAVAVDPPTDLIRDARIAVNRGVNISALAYRQLTAENNHLIGAFTDPLRGATVPMGATPAPVATTPTPAKSQAAEPTATQAKPGPRARTAGTVTDLWKSVVGSRGAGN